MTASHQILTGGHRDTCSLFRLLDLDQDQTDNYSPRKCGSIQTDNNAAMEVIAIAGDDAALFSLFARSFLPSIII